MPTVHEFNGYRVFIPSNDHRPAHVHIEKAENEAIFFLNCPNGPVALRENYGFKRMQINVMEAKLNPIARLLRKKGENVHGQP